MVTVINNIRDKFVPLAIALGMFLSICTNLRLEIFPVGPGELILLTISIYSLFNSGFKFDSKSPIFLFWTVAGLGMLMGWFFSDLEASDQLEHHSMAYIFDAFVTTGISLLLCSLDDKSFRRTIFYICTFPVVILWLGFIVYLFFDPEILKYTGIQTAFGDKRYSGWSINPNQLALFFVPLPIFIAGLWRGVRDVNFYISISYVFLLLMSVLLGFIVRSDGLFWVWLLEILVLILFRFRWDKFSSRSSIFIYCSIILLCAFLVKNCASGDIRSTIKNNFSSSVVNISANSESVNHVSKLDQNLGFGYGTPVQKSNIRAELWLNGVKSWLRSPWFGHGPGEYSWHTLPDGVNKTNSIESHNITIDFLTQGGVLAGFSWLLLIVYCAVSAIRIKDSYSLSLVVVIFVFTFFHNTRQPYLWIVISMVLELIKRKLFISNNRWEDGV